MENISEGKSWPKITGTYLQAWSNSEHLRVWYQYFLGIKPDMINNNLNIKPMIPDEINNLEYSILVGNGKVEVTYEKSDVTKYTYKFTGLNTTIHIDIFPYETVNIETQFTQEITLIDNGKELLLTMILFLFHKKSWNKEK